MSQFREKYKSEISPALQQSGGYANVMDIPKLEKVVINIAVDTGVDKDTFAAVLDDLAAITGQRPAVTRARKSVSNFKLREGMPIGAKVTLRGKRMYEFMERLISATLPRIRDFRGVRKSSFDGRGNYTLGLQEQSIFPEIDPDNIKKNQGMDISIVTTAATDKEAFELLKAFGMPFENA